MLYEPVRLSSECYQMAKTKILKSLRAVEHYLKKRGWNATSAIYRHAKAGLIIPDPDGGYTIQAALAYAHNHLRKLSDEDKENMPRIPEAVAPDRLSMAKRLAEAKKLAAQARHWERKTEILEGEWIKASVLDRALAQRAAMFKGDIENFIRSHASEMCHLVDGDDLKIPDLIDFWLEKSSIWLGRYADVRS